MGRVGKHPCVLLLDSQCSCTVTRLQAGESFTLAGGLPLKLNRGRVGRPITYLT
jgi:hypothetical protein